MWLVVYSLLGIAILLALGCWQIERRTWKLALIDRVEQRIHAVPAPLPDSASWPTISAAVDEYRRITVTGQFLHSRETLVKAVTEKGDGYWVLTPLKSEDGTTVLVNRGFIPTEGRDVSTRLAGNPSGTVQVSGLLRITEPKGGFLRQNDPAHERWYSRDVVAIAQARGLGAVAPFFIDADATPNLGGLPMGGLTVVRFDNNHLIYALTWFALASLLTGRLLTAFGLHRLRRLRSSVVRRRVGKTPLSQGPTESDAGTIVKSA